MNEKRSIRVLVASAEVCIAHDIYFLALDARTGSLLTNIKDILPLIATLRGSSGSVWLLHNWRIVV